MPTQTHDPAETNRQLRMIRAFGSFIATVKGALERQGGSGTGREIARLAGISASTINKPTAGNVDWCPSWRTLDRVVQATGVPIPPELVPGYPNLPDEIGRDRMVSFADNGHSDDLAGGPDVDNVRVRIMRLVLELDDGDVPTVERILAGLAGRSPPEVPRRLPPPKAGS